jgi:hypothetical protein
MAESEAFDRACTLLEGLTEFSRLEARGTIRIALKQAGLNASSVRASELVVVARAVLPGELESRGVAGSDSVCHQLCEDLSKVADSPSEDTPESVFSRLGGDSTSNKN